MFVAGGLIWANLTPDRWASSTDLRYDQDNEREVVLYWGWPETVWVSVVEAEKYTEDGWQHDEARFRTLPNSYLPRREIAKGVALNTGCAIALIFSAALVSEYLIRRRTRLRSSSGK